MIISNILNGTIGELEAKKFNIYFGISLGNKYFTENHIRSYIQWGVETTNSELAIVIADTIHAINIEVRNHSTPQRALSLAMKRGEKVYGLVSSIIKGFSANEQKKINLLRWQDINEQYRQDTEKILNFFDQDKEFKAEVISCTKSAFDTSSFNETEIERLAQYVLLELPFLIRGFIHHGIHFNLITYPGLGRVDDLAYDIGHYNKFASLSKSLNVSDPIAIADVKISG